LMLFQCSFSQKPDTLYHNTLYSYIELYPSESSRIFNYELVNEKKIFYFGNYKDTVKNGAWVYFYPNGKTLAKGNYKDGLKKGKWKYYVSDVPREVIFSKKSHVIDKINFDATGWPKVIDVIRYEDGSYSSLENGRQPTISRGHFLD